MANYKVSDTELISIADAIRTKSGSNTSLSFPSEFIAAIENLSISSGEAISSGVSAIGINDVLDNNGGTIRTITAVNLKNDTVTSAHLESGYTAHDAQGQLITGTLTAGNSTDFIIHISKNQQTNKWELNRTYAEIVTAYQAGKTLTSIVESNEPTLSSVIYDEDAQVVMYFILEESNNYRVAKFIQYVLTSNNNIELITDVIQTPIFTIVTETNTPSITCNMSYEEIFNYTDISSSSSFFANSIVIVIDENVFSVQSATLTRITSDLELYYYSGGKYANYEIIYSSSDLTVNMDPIDELTSADLIVSGNTITAPAGYYDSAASASVASMTLPTSIASSATSGFTSKATISRSTSDQYINIPTGYNATGAYYKINATPNGTVTAPATISGTSATVSAETNTLTLNRIVSVTPSVSTEGYISSGTAGNSSVTLTANVTTKAATTYHPSTSDQSISSGSYITGTQTIKGVTTSGLEAGNIKSGVTIKIGDSTDDDCVTSVTGTYTGSGGTSKATYIYSELASRTANSYGATNATVTVTKAGTYNISYVAIRGSSSGTMGTNLHIGSTAGTNNTTWNNGTYGQFVQLTNQSISANQAVTIYATSGSNSRAIYVGQLIVQEV